MPSQYWVGYLSVQVITQIFPTLNQRKTVCQKSRSIKTNKQTKNTEEHTETSAEDSSLILRPQRLSCMKNAITSLRGWIYLRNGNTGK